MENLLDTRGSTVHSALSIGADQVLLITTNCLGQGSEELGRTLIVSFFYTLKENDVFPGTMLFLNSGVYLTCEGSPVIDYLWALEQKGVRVMSSGTSLDFYRLKSRLCVGKVTNMYEIIEYLLSAQKVVTI